MRAECWIFLSETLPLPLRGKHRCVGTPAEIAAALGRAATARPVPGVSSGHVLAHLTFVLGAEDVQVWVNPAHVVAVMP